MTDGREKRGRIVIVGAGMGGSMLAHALSPAWDVTVVEIGDTSHRYGERVVDAAVPAKTDPHITSGLGGTTQLWHNGLIEVPNEVFAKRWPINKRELLPFYEEAIAILSGRTRNALLANARLLADEYALLGFDRALFSEWLFYPKKRTNPWQYLKVSRRVTVVYGEVCAFGKSDDGRISSVFVERNGQKSIIAADVFVLAAGALSTPVLLQKLEMQTLNGTKSNIGYHYEDHPSAVVGEVVLKTPLYRLWNYPCANGNLRLPFTVRIDRLAMSFQLRPAAQSWIVSPKKRIRSAINELRNNPLDIRLYYRLLTHVDDIMEVLSFLFNLNLPTKQYILLMVAEHYPSSHQAVRGDEKNGIVRDWRLDASLIDIYRRGIDTLLRKLQRKIESVHLYENWPENIYSSSHHAGTARMSDDASTGVCDRNNKVYGFDNLYIGDASAIPATGFSNTGLTIAALALRLAAYLNRPAVEDGRVGESLEVAQL